MDGTVVTVGLAAVIAGCVAGAIAVVVWLWGKFDAQTKALLRAIAESRRQGDERLGELGGKIEGLAARQAELELGIERRFVTKDSAAGTYQRLETMVAEIRQDVRSMLSRTLGGRGRIPPTT